MTIEKLATFGQRLKSRRKAKQMTQQQLSSTAGIAQSLISALERGERSGMGIEASTLFRLAGALEVSPSWLLTGDGDMDLKGSADLAELVRKLNMLTIGQIRAIDAAIDAMLIAHK